MSNDTLRQHLNQALQQELLETLKARFEGNMHRHPGLSWGEVESRLLAQPHKLAALYAMEQTGGQPDAVVLPREASRLTSKELKPVSGISNGSERTSASSGASHRE